MTRDEIIAKSRDLTTPVLGAATSAKLIERVLDLENLKSGRELRRCCSGLDLQVLHKGHRRLVLKYWLARADLRHAGKYGCPRYDKRRASID
ncbi:MAG TPA: hypothetical protein VLM42_14870 [Bryobacteraceae bacterium]|nr:hypothetical protein [Bryobacteraceae bacterium]